MATLILFEVNKFYKSKKNIIGIILLIVITFIFICFYTKNESLAKKSNILSCNIQMDSMKNSLNRAKIEYEAADSINKRTAIQRAIDDSQNRLNLLNEKYVALKSGDWLKTLTAEINYDKYNLELLQKGILQGEDPITILKRITKNEYLINNNIEPIDDRFSMTAYNFVRIAGGKLVPLILITLLFLLFSDFISKEIDDGTFKLILLQPISRTKIILSKIISCNVICIFTIGSIFVTFFIILGFVNGFGHPLYPVFSYTDNVNMISFIGIRRCVFYIIMLLPLLMIAITSIAILISTIAGNSIAALTISTLLYVTYYIFDSQVHIFNKIAHFIPFTYCNIPNIIDNTATAVYENCNITYRNGIIVLLLTTIINGTLSYLAIRKKDIL